MAAHRCAQNIAELRYRSRCQLPYPERGARLAPFTTPRALGAPLRIRGFTPGYRVDGDAGVFNKRPSNHAVAITGAVAGPSRTAPTLMALPRSAGNDYGPRHRDRRPPGPVRACQREWVGRGRLPRTTRQDLEACFRVAPAMGRL